MVRNSLQHDHETKWLMLVVLLACLVMVLALYIPDEATLSSPGGVIFIGGVLAAVPFFTIALVRVPPLDDELRC